MMEALVVGAIVALSLASTHLVAALRGDGGLLGALAALAMGVLASLLTGAAYHGALWRTLGRRGALPAGWWWSPTRYHDRLAPHERAAVLPWFYGGAASFVGVVLAALAVLWVVLGQR